MMTIKHTARHFQADEPPKPAKQQPPHPALPRREAVQDEKGTSVAGEEDPGSADEELRDYRPARDSD